jgi:hypothetical protein
MQSLESINSHNALLRHAEASEQPEVIALARYFEPCMSCGKTQTGTAATITVLCIEGRAEVVKVCPPCAKRRRLV